MQPDLKWLAAALCLQEGVLKQEGSVNVSRALEALQALSWDFGDRCVAFRDLVSPRHYEPRKLLVDLRKCPELFGERKSRSGYPIFFLTEEGRRLGQSELEFWPTQCAELVAGAFARIVPGAVRKKN
ncbi:MAG: hypothetical protein WEC84_03900 [Candidatus Andersenbacteria bacterium]